MCGIDPTLRERVRRQLELLRNNRHFSSIEWSIICPIIENALINVAQAAVGQKEERIRELEREDRELLARLNMLTFGNDPKRDSQIIELHTKGLSNSKIAKAVGMSKFGITKALRRLGVNQVD